VSELFNPKAFLSTVTSQPGVYRMYDAAGTVIYVGKAKDLKKRLSSYFRAQTGSRKTDVLVSNICNIDVTVTHTETEALLLEHNYIKLYQPRYNVLLRDDKSYPYIFLSGDTHPRLAMHRGAKHAKGEYFGPFPNGYAVRWACCRKSFLFASVRTASIAIARVPVCSIRLDAASVRA